MSEFTVAQERKVVTSIPGPKSQALHQRRLNAVSAGAGAALPVYIEKRTARSLLTLTATT
jgi:4-aminobutyrate aminotransferase/(S)-3-amino-2-methylpropionate transaminase